jgi:hypothetical protein
MARPVVVDPWPSGGIELPIEATPEECALLARRFDLVRVDRLLGNARLDRDRGGDVIRLSGRLEADVVQSCVVSLEDVPETVAETFECRFTRAAIDPDDVAWDQDLEPLEGAELDLGEIFAQQLSVALDPYPRAEGADALVIEGLGPNIAVGEEKPLAALAVAMMDGDSGVAPTPPPRQGRG